MKEENPNPLIVIFAGIESIAFIVVGVLTVGAIFLAIFAGQSLPY